MKAFVMNDAVSVADSLLSFAIESEGRFRPVGVVVCEPGARIVSGHSDYRAIGIPDCGLIEFKGFLLARIAELHPQIVEALQLSRSKVRRYRFHMTSMGDGDAIVPHADGGGPYGPDVAYTFLLYLHAYPKKFSGGNLHIHWPDRIEVIEPCHNLLVAFPGSAIHSVDLVSCQSPHFADRRFMLAGRAYLRRTPWQFICAAFNKGARTSKRWLGEGIRALLPLNRWLDNSM